WDKPALNEDGTKKPLPEPRPLPPEYWTSWLRPNLKDVKAPEDWPQEQKDRLEKLAKVNEELLAKGTFSGTNAGDSGLATVTRELTNMGQGMVVFTDGRSAEGSPKAFHALEQRARLAQIPIFVVAVGDDRPQVKIEVVDLRLPQQVQPEDKFRGVVEVT